MGDTPWRVTDIDSVHHVLTLYSEEEGAELRLTNAQNTFGSDPSQAKIVRTDPTLAPLQASIDLAGDVFVLHDLAQNG